MTPYHLSPIGSIMSTSPSLIVIYFSLYVSTAFRYNLKLLIEALLLIFKYV